MWMKKGKIVNDLAKRYDEMRIKANSSVFKRQQLRQRTDYCSQILEKILNIWKILYSNPRRYSEGM